MERIIVHIGTFTINFDCDVYYMMNYCLSIEEKNNRIHFSLMVYICIGTSTFSMGWIIWNKFWMVIIVRTVDNLDTDVSIYWKTLKIDERHEFFNIEPNFQFKYIFLLFSKLQKKQLYIFLQNNYIFTYFLMNLFLLNFYYEYFF